MPEPDPRTHPPQRDVMEPLYVIPDGGEVKLSYKDDVVVPDRIEILPGGFVKLVYKGLYQKDIVPRDTIEYISSHTQTEENEEWW